MYPYKVSMHKYIYQNKHKLLEFSYTVTILFVHYNIIVTREETLHIKNKAYT